MVLKFWYNLATFLILAGVFFIKNAQPVFAQDVDTSFDTVAMQEEPEINKSAFEERVALFDEQTQIKNEIVSLSFVWNTPVNIAAFRRNGKIWMVFDRPNAVNVAALKDEAKELAKEIYTLPHPNGTVVIVEPAEGVDYALRKEGLLWILDLYTGRAPDFATQNMTIFTQYDSMKNSYLFIPSNHTGNIISMIDPEVGDILSIATTSQLGLGFSNFYRYPDFDILQTAQGLAFVINAPDIVLNRGNSGVTLKALGRGLHITSDLDALKRNQKLKSEMQKDANAFDLQIDNRLVNKSLIEVTEDFKKQILAAPADQKNILRIKLAQYYVHYGLGTNALYILNQLRKIEIPESKTDKFYALSGIANFLARRYKEAVDDFSQGTLPLSTEGVFWRTVAQSALQYREENNAIIFAHMSLMKDYPQAVKDQVSIVAARNAIATNDDLSSQNFIDILASVPDRLRDLEPQIVYLTAQKMEMQGYIRNAIKEYQSLLDSNSEMFSAYARLHHTILSQMVNFIDPKTAIQELEKLRFAWGEKTFKIKLLNKLADFYLKDQDYYNALRILNEEGFLADKVQKEYIAGKMVRIFEDIFIGNHADEKLSPIKALALYNDFKWLAALSPHENLMMQKLADRLVAVDLLPRAQEILLSLLNKTNLTDDARARVGSRLGVIYLFENKPQEALLVLDATDSPNLVSETTNPRRIIRARALSQLGKTKQALDLLEDDTSPNALLHKFEIYWRAEEWNKASNTIKYLIQEPTPGKKLSDEQIGYVLDWATALKQAGKETVLIRLRNKFLPYFKGTVHESAFNVLTNHLEKEKVDIRAIHNIIDDVHNFNDYAKFYTESLKESAE